MSVRAPALGLAMLLLAGRAVEAQQMKPPAMSLAEAAARRWPQPVRVGDLLDRRVLRPLESQPTLGWVHEIVRNADGSIGVVVDYGGLFGHFGRPIEVPVEAMVLLGQVMEIVDFTPEQLNGFKTFEAPGTVPLPPGDIIRVGLARPSH